MENKVSVWKANLNTGVILGLIGIVYTLIMWFLDLTLAQWQGIVFLLILVVAIFLGIKAYRDNYLQGFITYGQSMGAGVVIMLYYSLITAVFAYILYGIIDPGLIDKLMAQTEQTLLDRGLSEGMIEQQMGFQSKIMVDWVLSLISIFNSMLMGTIISLIVSIFTRKEGNPLIDDSIEE
jgi:hypothetical protein